MTINKTDYIWFNGRLIPWNQAQVHVAAHALHYGSSVFEGIRAYETGNGAAVFCLALHIDRLFNSAKIYRMEIPYTKEEIEQAVVDTVKANEHKSCYIRPLVFRGFDNFSLNPQGCPVEVAIITIEWGRYLGPEAIEQGVDVGISSWRRMAPNTFPAAAKIGGQYINSQLIAMEAAGHGYAEGIALDVNGFVSEGSGENVFVVSNGKILTPPLASSILQGVTRHCVITLAEHLGYPVREELIPREALYVADEAFFTGTAAEISPIRSIDGIAIGAGRRGPITERLQAEFFGITSGQTPDRHGWLTLVS
ncbi:MAG: branched-chain amino acid transaminase [Chloroflexota bacterium]|nr:branched-chain amino acid transaminase [Chloroflexota bacterium]